MDQALISIEEIKANPYQPRQTEDVAVVEEIAADILKQATADFDGLLQPPTVRKNGHGYELAFGHTRRAAFAYLVSQGHERYRFMRAFVRELTDLQMFEMAVAENIKRRDLNPIEQAEAMARYMKDFGKTSVEAGEFFGVSEETVRGTVRLNNLPDVAKEHIRSGELNVTVARSLLTVHKLMPDKLPEIVNEIIEGEESPREIINNKLRWTDNIEDMWSDGRSGKPLAGYDLWPLDMKRFPNELLPELTGHVAVQALDCYNNVPAREIVLKWVETPVLNQAEANVQLDALDKIDPDYRTRLNVLSNPPTCTACPFYVKNDGIHYCGMKHCWSRKLSAWKKHLILNASKKLGIPMYDEAVDGPKYVLDSYDDRAYFTKGVDLRLMPKEDFGGHKYQSFKDVPSEAFVVLIGKTLEKKKEAEQKKRQAVREEHSEEAREQKLFKRTEKERKMLLWELTKYFESIFANTPLEAIDALHSWGYRTGPYGMIQTPDGVEDDNYLDEIILNVLQRAIFSDTDDEVDIMKSLLTKCLPAIEKIAKLWKIKLPKDWIKRFQELAASEAE